MTIFLLAVLAFIAASSFIIAIILGAQTIESSPQARIRKRITTVAPRHNTPRQLRKGNSFYSTIPQLHHLLAQSKTVHNLDLLLDRANVNLSVGLFTLLSLAMAAIAYLILSFIFSQAPALAVLGAFLTAAGPYLYMRYLARKRTRKFLEQLPDGLDIMAQGLHAGLGLSQSQTYVAKEMADPIGTEFSVFMEELNLGLPLNAALNNFQERMPIQETRLFNTALTVQRDVGGSLAELLNKLSDVIRERFRIEREIRTLTAQNRMAAWVVCSLPPALFFFMYTMDPQLMREVMDSTVGWFMLMGALVFEIIGIFVFRKLLQLHI
jgi:tight adherence protein B